MYKLFLLFLCFTNQLKEMRNLWVSSMYREKMDFAYSIPNHYHPETKLISIQSTPSEVFSKSAKSA